MNRRGFIKGLFVAAALTVNSATRSGLNALEIVDRALPAHVLVDYEQGTFTPTFDFQSENITTTGGIPLHYTRVGNTVTITGELRTTTVDIEEFKTLLRESPWQ